MGVTADIGFNLGNTHPGLILSWENSRYHYGQDLNGNTLTTTSNIFEILFRMRW
jgi:hypothetical protein